MSDVDLYETIKFLKEYPTKPSWLVIDHYKINIQWEVSVKPYVSNIFVIDDLADRSHDCDVILNSNLYSTNDIYNELIPSDCKKFIGPYYSLLGDQYRQYRESKLDIFPEINHVAIFMGGGDHFNITEYLIDHFFECFFYLQNKSVNISVVIGGQHPNKKSIEEKCKQYPFVTLYVDTPNLAQILANVDLCIGAGGVAALERCAIGVPSIVITFADNQIRGVDALAKNGAILYGGDFREPNWKNLFNEAVLKVRDLFTRQRLSKRSLQTVDANGCERIAAYMHFCIFDPDFKSVTFEDAAVLYEWRNSERVRNYSLNSDPIIYHEHENWLSASLTDPNQLLLMLWFGNKQCGHIRYKIKEDIATVSIIVNPIYYNIGVGHLMLVKSLPILKSFNENISNIQAIIHRDNISSMAVFRKAGYILTHRNDIWTTKYKKLERHSS